MNDRWAESPDFAWFTRYLKNSIHQISPQGIETFLISCCSVVLSLMLFAVVKEHFAVVIEKYEPFVQVRTSTVSPKPRTKTLEPMCFDSGVSWTFKCESEMDYSFLSQQKQGDKWFVSIHIDHVFVKLTLPIELPPDKQKSSIRLDQHNTGHVLLCKRVYIDAEKIAREAIAPVMKRTYTGEGDTLDEAAAQAVAFATRELTEAYSSKTQQVAQDMSDIYDFIELKRPPSFENSIEEAVSTYQRGKSRRL